jgi:hypothetical protein
MIARGMLPNSMGVVHWSIGQLVRNPGLMSTLRDGAYKQQALVPASAWLGDKAPDEPKAKAVLSDSLVLVTWKEAKAKDVYQWVVYMRYGKKWHYHILPGLEQSIPVQLKETVGKDVLPLEEIQVSAISRTGMESEKVRMKW